jgi:vesicle coat complex subunit
VVKLFLHMTLQMPATHQQVLERIKDPLKSLISREEPSTKYAVLCHVLLLLQRAPILFEHDYAAFYCRANDPWYIKRLKMQALSVIATPLNAYDIVTELTEYARDISPSMGKEAVKAIGSIALSVPDVGGIIERLLTFLDVGGPEHLIAEALVQMKDLLRRYPDIALVSSSLN